MEISDKLKILRKSNGLTQKKLADISGVSENAIKQYESNKRIPRIEQLKLLADALGQSPNYFLSDEQQDQQLLNDSVDIFSKQIIDNDDTKKALKGLLLISKALTAMNEQADEIGTDNYNAYIRVVEEIFFNIHASLLPIDSDMERYLAFLNQVNNILRLQVNDYYKSLKEGE